MRAEYSMASEGLSNSGRALRAVVAHDLPEVERRARLRRTPTDHELEGSDA